ncbi:hypothetical protein [Acidisoma sp. 7E03]
MDNDSGWAATEITLVTHDHPGGDEHLSLPCRWVELVQAWDGVSDAYFLVSGIPDADLPPHPWAYLTFQDVKRKQHRFPIGPVTRQGHALRLMRKPHAKA